MIILAVDDDRSVLSSLRLVLGRAGFDVTTAPDAEAAVASVRRQRPDLVLMDMNFHRDTTGSDGLELLRKVKILYPDLPVILMTGWGSIQLAVEGIKAGAADFVTKPWDNATLISKIQTHAALTTPVAADGEFDREGIIGQSEELEKVIRAAAKVAATDAPVLILGENGTGKEILAEAIHRNSHRARSPFVKVNLGGISRDLFESEMFGHKKGAFTGAVSDREGRFEAADGGTIFLDEIGDLDPSSQVKMLRVLQEHTFERLGESRPRKVDVRVISATNAPLAHMIAEGRFREDLFYRINLITLTLPPLRDRREDIPLLAAHFAEKASKGARFTPGALDLLSSLPLPGNVRELRNLVERSVLMSDSRIIGADAIQLHGIHDGISLLEEQERNMVLKAMKLADGNMARAAASLGVSRQTIYRRLRKYGYKK